MWPSAPGGSPAGASDFRYPAAVAQPNPPPVPLEVSALESYRFVFRQPDLVSNVLFSLLLQFIPIVGPIVRMGWSSETTRRLVHGHPRPIPKFSFSDFSKYLERGVVPFVAQLVIAFALLLPIGLLGVVLGITIPILSSNHSELGLVIGIIAAVLAVPVFTAYVLALHSTQLLAELSGDFKQTFTLSLHKAYLRLCWRKILITGIVFGLLTLGVMLLGALVCGVGLYFAVQLVMFANGHLRYQLYNAYRLLGGDALLSKPPTPTEEEQREWAAAHFYQPAGYPAAQPYPAAGYPAQPYPAAGYPAQPYPAAGYPPAPVPPGQGTPGAGYAGYPPGEPSQALAGHAYPPAQPGQASSAQSYSEDDPSRGAPPGQGPSAQHPRQGSSGQGSPGQGSPGQGSPGQGSSGRGSSS